MILRNQFASELQTQGNILRDIVDDMKTYRDLYDAAEKYGGIVDWTTFGHSYLTNSDSINFNLS